MSMYNIKLNKGDTVKIYVEPKSDFSKLECYGKLIELQEDYSCTFVMDYEQMYLPNVYSLAFMDASVDKKQLFINNIHEYLDYYLKEPTNDDVISFLKNMNSICNNKITSFNDMYNKILKYKEDYKSNNTHILNNVFNVNPKYIVRYLHQKKIKDWRPSLFELQKWKVELINNSDPFFIPFVSYRYITVLKKICPSDKTVANLTSNNIRYSKYV